MTALDRGHARYMAAKARYDAAGKGEKYRTHGVLVDRTTALLRAENAAVKRAR